MKAIKIQCVDTSHAIVMETSSITKFINQFIQDVFIKEMQNILSYMLQSAIEYLKLI